MDEFEQTEFTTKGLVRDFAFILVGTMLIAIGYALFLAPYNVVPGGIYGLGIIINYLTQGLWGFENGLPIGVIALCFNIPFFLLVVRNMGQISAFKTIVTFLLIAGFTDLINFFSSSMPLVDDEHILSACYGGAILGLGVYLVFLAGASCAGTDTLAQVLAKKTNLRVSRLIMIIDSIVVLFGLLALHDWKVPLYSWLTIFIYGKVVDALQPVNPHKSVFIISEKPNEIREELVTKMGIRGTFLHGRGMYHGKERDVIFIIIQRKNLQNLKKLVLDIDDNAFITTGDASNDTRRQLIV